MGFEDGLKYYVQYQMGTERHGVDKQKESGYLTSAISPRIAMNEDYAFWIMTNDTIAMKADNATGYTKTPIIARKTVNMGKIYIVIMTELNLQA